MAQREKAETIELREFVANFKFSREMLGKSQGDIGRAANVTQEFISQLESASTSIGLDTMSELSEAVQIPLYLLVDPAFKASFNFKQRASIWKDYVSQRPYCEFGSSERVIFGKNFKERRENIKFSQRDIYKKMGFAQADIVFLEQGKISSSITTLANLARTVGRSLSFLLKP